MYFFVQLDAVWNFVGPVEAVAQRLLRSLYIAEEIKLGFERDRAVIYRAIQEMAHSTAFFTIEQ